MESNVETYYDVEYLPDALSAVWWTWMDGLETLEEAKSSVEVARETRDPYKIQIVKRTYEIIPVD